MILENSRAAHRFFFEHPKEHDSLNASELLGRGIAQGISTTYYPSQDRTAGEIATKWGYSIMRDALTTVFR